MLDTGQGKPAAGGWRGDDSKIPLIRRWLGDHCYQLLILRDANPEIRHRYEAAFPEAVVMQPQSPPPRPPH